MFQRKWFSVLIVILSYDTRQNVGYYSLGHQLMDTDYTGKCPLLETVYFVGPGKLVNNASIQLVITL